MQPWWKIATLLIAVPLRYCFAQFQTLVCGIKSVHTACYPDYWWYIMVSYCDKLSQNSHSPLKHQNMLMPPDLQQMTTLLLRVSSEGHVGLLWPYFRQLYLQIKCCFFRTVRKGWFMLHSKLSLHPPKPSSTMSSTHLLFPAVFHTFH